MNYAAAKWVFGALFGSLVSLSACGTFEYGLPEPVGDNGDEAADGDFQSVELTAECETGECLASDGFTVESDGSFTVGPAANGETARGTVTDQELNELSRAVDRVLQTSRTAGTQCENIATSPATRDQVTIEDSEGDELIALDEIGSEGQVCFRGNRADAIALQNLLRDLVGIYQPANFPERDETEDTIPEPVSPV